MIHRREWCARFGKALAAAFVAPAAFATIPELVVDRMRSDNAAASSERRRNYRVDASVSLLGVTVYSQKGLGRAFASLSESCGMTRRFTSLQFAGMSIPELAHGVNFGGSAEEAVEECNGQRRLAYFGFVTDSDDDDVDRAQRRLASSAQSTTYVAVAGTCASGCIENRRALIDVPSTGFGLGELIARVRTGFRANGAKPYVVSHDSRSATFLYSVLAAVRDERARFETTYIHNGEIYRLECQKSPEGAGLTRLHAQIKSRSGRHVSSFKLWNETRSDFPLRIEFQPRSYLRLVLEAEQQNA